MTLSGPKLLLHAEGLAVLATSCCIYANIDASWRYFALLFLAPDLSMIGYLVDKKVGAWCYNAAHTYLGPALLGGSAFAMHQPALLSIAVIWTAHIGFDRLLGYGLKYTTDFKDTHLHRV
jgi:hypothetical protein